MLGISLPLGPFSDGRGMNRKAEMGKRASYSGCNMSVIDHSLFGFSGPRAITDQRLTNTIRREITLWLVILLSLAVLLTSVPAVATPRFGWGTPIPIEFTPPWTGGPRVAVTPGGNGVAVWEQDSTSGTVLGASRYLLGFGWTAPAQISGAYAAGPRVAIDPE